MLFREVWRKLQSIGFP
uniref:Hypothetical chloroplast RF68 n=33 Tax=Ilex TaxID=4295 RepID=A0A649UJT1_9AQUA|nr:hypothetical chloroplast RF68 [Ilex asprella]YP_009713967.1 hypothetical chloroplast RF68 [Ilex asprella]YP_009763423.1 hypothetical chloroplast RF68 [Ilex latifolia]YP_009763442.1 hypothetical chloroplast RF68 [Ilex latifolia]YP_010138930.1 putative chloroplast RF68 [Ilex vomitoria]YP_010343063.1 putative chloroplast RF68 [Ilex cornuta x Ilex latifolia]YP_010571010.1 hypothetical chloroplast RF68 [Ilex fukienensis]YP_010571026.1 hypothetical chloroplast RF68 [Ilex fukienensis]YP_0105711